LLDTMISRTDETEGNQWHLITIYPNITVKKYD